MYFCKPPKRGTHPEAYKLWWNTEKRYQRQLVKADLASLSAQKRATKKFYIKRRFINAYQKELAAMQQPQPGVPSGMGGEGGGLMGPGVTSSTVSAASQSVVRNGGGQVRRQAPVEISGGPVGHGIGGQGGGLMGPGVTSLTVSAASQSVVRNGGGHVRVGGMLDYEVGPVSHQKPVENSGGIPMFVDIGRQEPVEMEISKEEVKEINEGDLEFLKLELEAIKECDDAIVLERKETEKVVTQQGEEIIKKREEIIKKREEIIEKREEEENLVIQQRNETCAKKLQLIQNGRQRKEETIKRGQTPKKRAPTTDLESVSDVSDREEEEEEEEAMEDATQKEVVKAKAVAKKVSFMVTPKKPKATPKKASAKKAKAAPKSKTHVVEDYETPTKTRSARKSRTPSHFRDFEMES